MKEVKEESIWHPGSLTEAIFLQRLNRFVAEVELAGERVLVHVPNTGRMGELIMPGVMVKMIPSGGKYPWRVIYFYYKDQPVLIDSIASNAIFASLLAKDLVPGMEGSRVVKREPPWGRHRFDFSISDHDGNIMMVELKSCTLAWKNIAAFPDAVSSRAAEHIRALSETGNGKLIFLNFHEAVDIFLPNYHTDFHLYETLKAYRGKIDIRSYSVVYNKDLSIGGCRPMEVMIPEVKAGGIYLLILENDRDRDIETGSLGWLHFKEGYYVFAGCDNYNIFKRIEQHRRKRRSPDNHIDFISAEMKIKADMPIISDQIDECSAAEFIRSVGGEDISPFSSSDCTEVTNLFYFRENPLQKPAIWDFLLSSRLDSFR